jgi:oxalate decarboxylase
VKTEEFGPGHVAFIKQGYGHFIEQVGDEPTRILILFNSGLYQEISLTNWLGGNPNSLLTSNFGISQDMLDRLPKKEVGILGKVLRRWRWPVADSSSRSWCAIAG